MSPHRNAMLDAANTACAGTGLVVTDVSGETGRIGITTADGLNGVLITVEKSYKPVEQCTFAVKYSWEQHAAAWTCDPDDPTPLVSLMRDATEPLGRDEAEPDDRLIHL
jgi:hypothetical protein